MGRCAHDPPPKEAPRLRAKRVKNLCVEKDGCRPFGIHFLVGAPRRLGFPKGGTKAGEAWHVHLPEAWVGRDI